MNPTQTAYKKSSFGPAFLFLDKKRRRALATYYAFCRLMDDIADEPGIADREKQLAFWQEEIQRVYAYRSTTPLSQELQKIVLEFGITSDRFLWLIEGMQADVQGRRYEVRSDLEWYLWRVASIVGLATLDILGIKGHNADELARALGFAVQVTNIIRDVHEDARLGRVYLPDDLLRKFGLVREDVLNNTKPEQLAQVLDFLAQACKQDYEQAYKIMDSFSPREILPCRVMGFVYRANLAKIEKKNFKFKRAIKLSKFEKIKICVYAWFQTISER